LILLVSFFSSLLDWSWLAYKSEWLILSVSFFSSLLDWSWLA
jgi:hypothetical protein